MAEIFRIDCFVKPFDKPRRINRHDFTVAFDNPDKPKEPTGLVHVGELEADDLRLYEGLDEHFPITRLGSTQEEADDANAKLVASRFKVKVAAKEPVKAPAPESGKKAGA